MRITFLSARRRLSNRIYLIWARWFETADRRVALTEVSGIRVSTVFLGLDYRFSGEGPPLLLFETMTFPRWRE